jgi:hypothetical protein
MNKLYTIILTVCVMQGVSAQVPGYLGKKVAIGYTVNSGIPFAAGFMRYNPTANYDGEKMAAHYTFRHNFLMEWVVGRSISIEGGFGFSKSGMFHHEYEPEYFEFEYPGLSNDFDLVGSNAPRKYDYTRVNNQFYKIGVNFFKGAYIAPHGTYWNFSYMQNVGTVSYVLNNTATDFSRITHHGVLISKGYRRIIANSFIIDYGFGFGYMFGPDAGEFSTSSETTVGTPDYEGSLARNQTNLLNSGILLNMHVGVKYLIPKFY